MTRRRKPARSASKTVRDLVRLIDDSGMTYHAACQAAGVEWHRISEWKSGRIAPSVLTVETFCEVLGYELVVRKRD